MSQTFLWVPFDDPGWNFDMYGRRYKTEYKLLPHADGNKCLSTHSTLPDAAHAEWSAVKRGDTLIMAAHGKGFSTTAVAWKTQGGEIKQWSAQEFALRIRQSLGDERYNLPIKYELLACFGANNISPLAPSFGKRLAAEMRRVGLKGELTAYKGATGMDTLRGRQIGSSRFTYFMSKVFHRGELIGGQATSDSAKTWQLD